MNTSVFSDKDFLEAYHSDEDRNELDEAITRRFDDILQPPLDQEAEGKWNEIKTVIDPLVKVAIDKCQRAQSGGWSVVDRYLSEFAVHVENACLAGVRDLLKAEETPEVRLAILRHGVLPSLLAEHDRQIKWCIRPNNPDTVLGHVAAEVSHLFDELLNRVRADVAVMVLKHKDKLKPLEGMRDVRRNNPPSLAQQHYQKVFAVLKEIGALKSNGSTKLDKDTFKTICEALDQRGVELPPDRPGRHGKDATDWCDEDEEKNWQNARFISPVKVKAYLDKVPKRIPPQ
jgi:hypothetical protein